MLLRNIIFARFLSASDFAVTLTFGLVLSLFEYITNFGHENFMQRSVDGELKRFQATMHSTMIARGIMVSLGIVLVSPLIPKLLNIESIEFNYALLALVPLIKGFSHLDHQRFHRQQNYITSAKIALIADISSVLIALVSISIWDSYWAFYASFVFRHSISTILSHIYSERKYTLALDQQYIYSLVKFGAPLLLVGLLKYIGIEFDKAIVARIAGLEIFAVYVLTLMLLVNGTNIVSLALSKIFIRRISTSGENIKDVVVSNGLIQSFLVLPLLVLLCGLGENIILIVFGAQYTTVPFLIVAVGAVVGLRAINQWLNQTVIASSPTNLMLISDLVRVCVALFAVWLVYSEGNVIKIALAFWLSELFYFATLSFLLNKTVSVLNTSIRMLFIYILIMASVCILYVISFESNFFIKIIFSCLMFFFIAANFMFFSKTCRTQVKQLITIALSKLRLT